MPPQLPSQDGTLYLGYFLDVYVLLLITIQSCWQEKSHQYVMILERFSWYIHQRIFCTVLICNIINSGSDHSIARRIYHIMKISHKSAFISYHSLKIVALYKLFNLLLRPSCTWNLGVSLVKHFCPWLELVQVVVGRHTRCRSTAQHTESSGRHLPKTTHKEIEHHSRLQQEVKSE